MTSGPLAQGVAMVKGALDRHQPPAGPETAFLGLGGNLGDRLANLTRAVDLLHRHDRIDVVDVSSVYETQPIGVTPVEPDDDVETFYNIAVRVTTTLSPARLLRACLQVETALGRERPHRWAPRTIDVDILVYGDRELDHPTLQIPHPRLTERAFALVPLMEVAPGWRLPDGRSLGRCAADLAPIEGIAAIGRQVPVPETPPGMRP